MYIALPDPWGWNTAKQNATANSSPENNTECGPVRAPAQGRQREEQAAPPPKKKQRGEGGGRENSPQPPNRPPTPPEAAKPPPQKAPETGPPKRHRGTTQPKPATPSQEQRPTGKRDTETCRHTPRKKKRASSPARKKGDAGTGTARPGSGTPSNRHHQKKKKGAKNTPRQPSQEGRGTAETRAQHARPHRTTEPETAGGKRGAHKTTHIP